MYIYIRRELNEKTKNPESISTYMDTNTHVYIQTHKNINIHTHPHKKQKNKKAKRKHHICRGQRLSWIINSNRTFSGTNPEIKNNRNPIKTVTAIKAKGSAQTTHYLPEDNSKFRNTCRRKNTLKIKFTMHVCVPALIMPFAISINLEW